MDKQKCVCSAFAVNEPPAFFLRHTHTRWASSAFLYIAIIYLLLKHVIYFTALSHVNWIITTGYIRSQLPLRLACFSLGYPSLFGSHKHTHSTHNVRPAYIRLNERTKIRLEFLSMFGRLQQNVFSGLVVVVVLSNTTLGQSNVVRSHTLNYIIYICLCVDWVYAHMWPFSSKPPLYVSIMNIEYCIYNVYWGLTMYRIIVLNGMYSPAYYLLWTVRCTGNGSRQHSSYTAGVPFIYRTEAIGPTAGRTRQHGRPKPALLYRLCVKCAQQVYRNESPHSKYSIPIFPPEWVNNGDHHQWSRTQT